jgi:hypothetical protein
MGNVTGSSVWLRTPWPSRLTTAWLWNRVDVVSPVAEYVYIHGWMMITILLPHYSALYQLSQNCLGLLAHICSVTCRLFTAPVTVVESAPISAPHLTLPQRQQYSGDFTQLILFMQVLNSPKISQLSVPYRAPFVTADYTPTFCCGFGFTETEWRHQIYTYSQFIQQMPVMIGNIQMIGRQCSYTVDPFSSGHLATPVALRQHRHHKDLHNTKSHS